MVRERAREREWVVVVVESEGEVACVRHGMHATRRRTTRRKTYLFQALRRSTEASEHYASPGAGWD